MIFKLVRGSDRQDVLRYHAEMESLLSRGFVFWGNGLMRRGFSGNDFSQGSSGVSESASGILNDVDGVDFVPVPEYPDMVEAACLNKAFELHRLIVNGCVGFRSDCQDPFILLKVDELYSTFLEYVKSCQGDYRYSSILRAWADIVDAVDLFCEDNDCEVSDILVEYTFG